MSEIYIEYPQKVDLFVGPQTNHVFSHYTRFTLHYLQLNTFFRTTMRAEYCPADLDIISLPFSQKKRGW